MEYIISTWISLSDFSEDTNTMIAFTSRVDFFEVKFVGSYRNLWYSTSSSPCFRYRLDESVKTFYWPWHFIPGWMGVFQLGESYLMQWENLDLVINMSYSVSFSDVVSHGFWYIHYDTIRCASGEVILMIVGWRWRDLQSQDAGAPWPCELWGRV